MIGQRLAEEEPFGSAAHLSEQRAAIYHSLLRCVEGWSAASAALSAQLFALDGNDRERALRDPLTRRTIEDGICLFRQGLKVIDPATHEAILLGAVTSLGKAGGTLLNHSAHCVEIIPAPCPAFVWMNAGTDTIEAQRFVVEVQKRMPGLQIYSPSKEEIKTLRSGAALALRIAPTLAASAFDHVFLVVIAAFEQEERRFASLTVPGLPGVVLLSPNALSDEFRAAHSLLHEAMHLKFIDIDYVHPLFKPGFRAISSPRVTPVWHADKPGLGDWPIDRVLTSMHVYITLGVFFEEASQPCFAGSRIPPTLAEDIARCRERARWLHTSALEHQDVLSAAGQQFVAFNGSLLEHEHAAA